MATARFSVTEDAPQFVAVADTSSKETFQGVFRRSTQPTLCCSGITMPSKAGGEAVDVWLGISGGGEEGVSTSKTPRSAKKRRIMVFKRARSRKVSMRVIEMFRSNDG